MARKIVKPKPTPATREVFVEKSEAVLAVEAEIENLLPAQLMLRTSRNLPSTVTYKDARNEDGETVVYWITELHYPTPAERNKAQEMSAKFFTPALQSQQIVTAKVKSKPVIQIPLADSVNDWENIALEDQRQTIAAGQRVLDQLEVVKDDD